MVLYLNEREIEKGVIRSITAGRLYLVVISIEILYLIVINSFN